MFLKILMTCRSKCFLEFLISIKTDRRALRFVEKCTKKRDMFLRFQRIALDVSYGFGQNRSMFLIVVFPIKKACIRLTLFSL